jgi:hypothetical protein
MSQLELTPPLVVLAGSASTLTITVLIMLRWQ